MGFSGKGAAWGGGGPGRGGGGTLAHPPSATANSKVTLPQRIAGAVLPGQSGLSTSASNLQLPEIRFQSNPNISESMIDTEHILALAVISTDAVAWATFRI